MKVACSYLASALSLRKIGAIHTRHLDFKATVSSTLFEQYSFKVHGFPSTPFCLPSGGDMKGGKRELETDMRKKVSVNILKFKS